MSPRRLLLASLLVATGGCAKLDGLLAKPHDEIKFSHATHLKNEVDCELCHDTISKSAELAAKRELPMEDTCIGCHSDWKEQNQCDKCHTNASLAKPWPKVERLTHMNHELHLKKEKLDCTRCHVQRSENPGILAAITPMAACTSCHNHEESYAQARCDKCHETLDRFPLKPLASFSHSGDWLHEHGQSARAEPQSCAVCHDQQTCAQCHAQTVATPIELQLPERVDRDFVHRGDWVSRHAIEQAADPAMCARCHQTRFCDSCHTENGITTRAPDAHDPHPAGWGSPYAKDFHGHAARENIESCAACHDQGASSSCVRCHKVGGVGGDPHPPGWESRHPHGDIAKSSMCLVCHSGP